MPRHTLLLRQVTVLLRLRTALRSRVSMSAIGSPIAIVSVLSPGVLGPVSLPAGLPHARDLALEGELPEHDAADAELAVHAAGATRQLAPAHDAGGELGLAPALGHLCLGRHFFSPAAGA